MFGSSTTDPAPELYLSISHVIMTEQILHFIYLGNNMDPPTWGLGRGANNCFL